MPASFRNTLALSIFSQVNSGSFRPKWPIGGGLPEDRTAELEVLDDAPRRHREVLAHELIQIVHGHLLRIFRIDEDGDRISHTDRISQLHLALVGQAGCDDVFCDVPSHVRRRAVDLSWGPCPRTRRRRDCRARRTCLR